MARSIAGISMVILLAAVGGIAVAQVEVQPGPGLIPAPVQVIRSEMEVLDRPVVLEVQIDPSLGVDTSMRILCATTTYRGEIHMDRQDSRIRLSISGEIKDLGEGKIFVSFDVEAQSDDVNGGRGIAGGGGAILAPGKPSNVLTIGGRSLILTVTLAPDESKPPAAELQ
jgi:hypothetical protein